MEHKHYKPNHNSIYKLDEILNVIEYVLITSHCEASNSERVLQVHLGDPLILPSLITCINLRSSQFQAKRDHFNKFSRLNIFEKIYIEILSFYFKYNKSGKLKYLSSFTSHI